MIIGQIREGRRVLLNADSYRTVGIWIVRVMHELGDGRGLVRLAGEDGDADEESQMAVKKFLKTDS